MKKKSEPKTIYIEVTSGEYEGYRGYLTDKKVPSGKTRVIIYDNKGGEPVGKYLDSSDYIEINRK